VDETIRSLSATDAIAIVGPAADLPAFGLDPPAAKATLKIADGTAETVRFGKAAPEEGTLYACREGRPYVLKVRASLLDRFSRKTHETPPSEPPADEHNPAPPSGAGAITPG
jgi:hypothetical protein